MPSVFIVHFSAVSSDATTRSMERSGTAWISDDGRVVTTFHVVGDIRRKTWASADFTGGRYTLRAANGNVLASLSPRFASHAADIAVLNIEEKLNVIAEPLPLATGLIHEEGKWQADGYPLIASAQGFRLTGTVTAVHEAPGPRQIELFVEQGASVDWARASGTPVMQDNQVIGMLTSQFDGANTCYAIGPHAIALALWAERCVSALPADKLAMVLQAVDTQTGEDSSLFVEDRLGNLLFAGGVSGKAWHKALVDNDIGDAERNRFASLFSQPPEVPPFTVEDDLRRRASRLLRANEEPTSNKLLAAYYATAAISIPVFVPPQLVAQQSKSPDDIAKSEAHAESMTNGAAPKPLNYEALLHSLLEIGADRPTPRRLAILGEAGSGKTTLLQNLAKNLLEAEHGLPMFLRYEELRGQPLFGYLTGDWLLRQQISPEFFALYERAMRRLHTAGKLWIFIDGIDEAGSDSRAPLEHIGRELAAGFENAHVIVACRQAYWYFGLNELYRFKVYELEGFSESQMQEAIGLWLSALPDKGDSLFTELRQPSRAYLLDSVQNPLRLAMLCALWREHTLQQRPLVDALPKTRTELYEQFVALFFDWNAQRLVPHGVDRAELMPILGEIALEALEHGGESGEIDKDILRRAIGSAGAPALRSIRESGWLVPLPSSKPGSPTYRFTHRTLLEFFAAQGLEKNADALLATVLGSPCYRALSPRWREVCLFWIGRTDISTEAKDALLDRLAFFNDHCGGFYRDSALYLAAACLSEHPDHQRGNEIVMMVVQQAVATFHPETGRWVRMLESVRDAALTALRHAPHDLVREATLGMLGELETALPVHDAIGAALFEALTGAVGFDNDAGAIAARMLLFEWANVEANEVQALFENEGFYEELESALRRRGRQRELAIEILGMPNPKRERTSALLFMELRRARSRSARQKLHTAIARLGYASAEDLRFMEDRAFSPRTREQDLYLNTLRDITPAPVEFAQRLFEAARSVKQAAEKQRYIKQLQLLETPTDAVVDDILANLANWASVSDIWDLFSIAAAGCRRNPAFVPRYVEALIGFKDPRFVWNCLLRLRELPACPSSANEPLNALIAAYNDDGVRFWATNLLLKTPGSDRISIVKTLVDLVGAFRSPIARQLETPWLAAMTLHRIAETPPELVDVLTVSLNRENDVQMRLVIISCLEIIAKGSLDAAKAVLALLERCGDVNYQMKAWRTLAEIGVNEPAIAMAIVSLARKPHMRDEIRWPLECMKKLRIGGDDAFQLAMDVVLSGAGDRLTLEAALEYLATRSDHRQEVISAALKCMSSSQHEDRMCALRCLGEIGTKDARVLECIAKMLGDETDGQAFHAALLAFRNLFGDITHAPRVIRILRDAWETEVLVDNNPNWRRTEILALLKDISARVKYEDFGRAWQAKEAQP